MKNYSRLLIFGFLLLSINIFSFEPNTVWIGSRKNRKVFLLGYDIDSHITVTKASHESLIKDAVKLANSKVCFITDHNYIDHLGFINISLQPGLIQLMNFKLQYILLSAERNKLNSHIIIRRSEEYDDSGCLEKMDFPQNIIEFLKIVHEALLKSVESQYMSDSLKTYLSDFIKTIIEPLLPIYHNNDLMKFCEEQFGKKAIKKINFKIFLRLYDVLLNCNGKDTFAVDIPDDEITQQIEYLVFPEKDKEKTDKKLNDKMIKFWHNLVRRGIDVEKIISRQFKIWETVDLLTATTELLKTINTHELTIFYLKNEILDNLINTLELNGFTKEFEKKKGILDIDALGKIFKKLIEEKNEESKVETDRHGVSQDFIVKLNNAIMTEQRILKALNLSDKLMQEMPIEDIDDKIVDYLRTYHEIRKELEENIEWLMENIKNCTKVLISEKIYIEKLKKLIQRSYEDSSAKKELELKCAGCSDHVSKLMDCGKCQVTKYCSKTCQLKHWPYHKSFCQSYCNNALNVKIIQLKIAYEDMLKKEDEVDALLFIEKALKESKMALSKVSTTSEEYKQAAGFIKNCEDSYKTDFKLYKLNFLFNMLQITFENFVNIAKSIKDEKYNVKIKCSHIINNIEYLLSSGLKAYVSEACMELHEYIKDRLTKTCDNCFKQFDRELIPCKPCCSYGLIIHYCSEACKNEDLKFHTPKCLLAEKGKTEIEAVHAIAKTLNIDLKSLEGRFFSLDYLLIEFDRLDMYDQEQWAIIAKWLIEKIIIISLNLELNKILKTDNETTKSILKNIINTHEKMANELKQKINLHINSLIEEIEYFNSYTFQDKIHLLLLYGYIYEYSDKKTIIENEFESPKKVLNNNDTYVKCVIEQSRPSFTIEPKEQFKSLIDELIFTFDNFKNTGYNALKRKCKDLLEEIQPKINKQEKNIQEIIKHFNKKFCRVCNKFTRNIRSCKACFDAGIEIKYCSKECQREDWKGHKNSCYIYKDQKEQENELETSTEKDKKFINAPVKSIGNKSTGGDELD